MANFTFRLEKKLVVTAFILLNFSCSIAQPFVDIISISNQRFSTSVPKKGDLKLGTNNTYVNLFIPKEFKNGNTLLVRTIYENIAFSPIPKSYLWGKEKISFQAFSLPIGFQFLSKSKKWKSLFMLIPKVSGDKGSVNNFQIGGITLFTYIKSENVKFKAGLYYNKEFFGNFFVPLVGVDWKISDRFNLYGVLPTNYKAEYRLTKNIYSGLNFRSFTRSYRFSDGYYSNNYLRIAENQLKLFFDFYIKKVVFFAEAGYSLGCETELNDKIDYTSQPYYPYTTLFSKYKDNFVFNIGLAYRVRFDRTQK